MDRIDATASDVCETCLGAGWTVSQGEGGEEARPCPDCRSRNKLQRLLDRAGIPRRYRHRDPFGAYKVHHPLQGRALALAKRFVERFPVLDRGLLFVGPCGVGKTHLAVAILQSIIQQKKVPGRFVDEAELLRRLQYSYGPDSPETEREVMIPLMEVELLVWDDLGTGRPTEWVAETIRTVINRRYTHNKTTILTTNLPLEPHQTPAADSRPRGAENLRDRIGVRLYSRILEMCQEVRVEGPDFRTQLSKAAEEKEEAQPTVPAASLDVRPLLRCPSCRSRRIKELDRAESGHGADRSLDLAAQCEACGKRISAKYTVRTGKMEYFE